MQLSPEEILQLAPDDSSAKAAKGLVVAAKWPRLGQNEAAMWGECQGSGSKPYQVQVDLSGPVFKCSCPSRKFPCKHGLALMLLSVQQRAAFKDATVPSWVDEWLNSRQQRAEKQEKKQAEARDKADAAPADPQAAAKREATRAKRMHEGLDELERWLNDRVRQGLAQLPGQRPMWQEIAARMVDSQLPGLAFRLRRIADLVDRDEGWEARVLAELGQLRLLSDAFRRADSLPPAVLTDVRAALGLTVDKDEVLGTGEKVNDRWFVFGQSVDEEERLWVRRVWLQGLQSGRRAMLLDYAHGTRRFELTLLTGSTLQATLAFYPGSASLRALPADAPVLVEQAGLPQATDLPAALDALGAGLAANPWQWPQSLQIGDGVPRRFADGWFLHTAGNRKLPLDIRDQDAWQLVAESGGAAVRLFGEWDGTRLRPLSCWMDSLVWQENT